MEDADEPDQVEWERLHARARRRPLPLVGAGGDEEVAEWVAEQRLLRLRNLLDPDRVEVLKHTPGWTWELPEARWYDRYCLVRDFVAEHGRLPELEESRAGCRVGAWCYKQRSAALTPEHRNLLDRLPGWNQREDEWEKSYAALRAFVGARGRLPWPRERHGGEEVCSWARAQLADARLPPARARRLEEVPGWAWVDAGWFLLWRAAHKHAATRGALRPADECSGFRVGLWAVQQCAARRAGALDARRVGILAAEPWWCWDLDVSAAAAAAGGCLAPDLRAGRELPGPVRPPEHL